MWASSEEYFILHVPFVMFPIVPSSPVAVQIKSISPSTPPAKAVKSFIAPGALEVGRVKLFVLAADDVPCQIDHPPAISFVLMAGKEISGTFIKARQHIRAFCVARTAGRP